MAPGPRSAWGSGGGHFKGQLCVLSPEVHRASRCCPGWVMLVPVTFPSFAECFLP